MFVFCKFFFLFYVRLIHVDGCNSSKFTFIPLCQYATSHTFFYKWLFGCFQFVALKTRRLGTFFTCFHKQDFLGFSQDWEQLGDEEYTSPVLLHDEIFFQIGVLKFPPFHVLADIQNDQIFKCLLIWCVKSGTQLSYSSFYLLYEKLYIYILKGKEKVW